MIRNTVHTFSAIGPCPAFLAVARVTTTFVLAVFAVLTHTRRTLVDIWTHNYTRNMNVDRNETESVIKRGR